MHLQTRPGKFRENTKIHLSFGEQLFRLWFRYNSRLPYFFFAPVATNYANIIILSLNINEAILKFRTIFIDRCCHIRMTQLFFGERVRNLILSI